MAVDFVRSCYQSAWFLFRDSPTTPVVGEYYFSPDGAPAYPGWHLYGSKNWHPENHPIEQGLGESLEAKQRWRKGNLPAWPVRVTAVGDADCIAGGERVADGFAVEDSYDGILPACILPQDPFEFLWSVVSDFDNCLVQRVYAFIIVAMINDDENAVRKVIVDWLGDGPTIAFHPQRGVWNGITTITTPSWQVVIMDGTRNAQQFALQGFAFVAGPTNFGTFSTAPLWYQAADRAIATMQDDNFPLTGKLMCVGHSYGGAVASLVAAKNRAWLAEKEIRYLTFGMPKLGDSRIVDLVNKCQGLGIINEGDLVTILPPDAYLLAALVPLFPLLPLPLYTEWERVKPQSFLRDDGVLIPERLPGTDTVTLLQLVTRVITQQQIDPIEQHYMVSYLARLQLRCPECAFPCEEVVCEEIRVQNPVLALTVPPNPKIGRIVFNQPSSIMPGETCLGALDWPLGVVFSGVTRLDALSFIRIRMDADVFYTLSYDMDDVPLFQGFAGFWPCPVSPFASLAPGGNPYVFPALHLDSVVVWFQATPSGVVHFTVLIKHFF